MVKLIRALEVIRPTLRNHHLRRAVAFNVSCFVSFCCIILGIEVSRNGETESW